ncbi:MAG: type II toxin-antitoxin system Phd/YefM family antitoxin [Pseudobdellovibrionaceae bacterium]
MRHKKSQEVGTAELKAKLTQYLNRVYEGETFFVMNRSIAVAELKPVDGGSSSSLSILKPTKSFSDVIKKIQKLERVKL